MQLLFAAPFLLAAALAFTILAAVPPWRRWALPIPTGLIAANPCLFAGIGVVLLVNHGLGYDSGPQPKILLVCLSVGIPAGIVGGAVAGFAARFVAAILPRLLLQIAILIAGWCSYFVLFVVLNIAASARWHLSDNLAVWITGAILAFIAAWFTARNPEPFRSSRIHLPVGSRFARRRPVHQ
jgi:hypothetical protein